MTLLECFVQMVGVKFLQAFLHETVMLEETVDALQPRSGGKYVDCTLGGAGHSARLLERSQPAGRLLAFDQDETAIRNAEQKLSAFDGRFTLIQSNFRDIASVIHSTGYGPVDGVMFDLGVSSPQFDEAERGFSYRQDAELDMRMDRSQGRTAADIVNESDEGELARIFFRYGEEKFSRSIARRIAKRRAEKPLETTTELAELIKEAIPAAARRTGPHPARRVFQALRIAVNDELDALSDALEGALQILAPGGRIAVISFHSLEDRIVKQTFVEWAKGCICPPELPICQCHRQPDGRIVTKKPLLPSEDEVERNPRARSAKLRVFEKH